MGAPLPVLVEIVPLASTPVSENVYEFLGVVMAVLGAVFPVVVFPQPRARISDAPKMTSPSSTQIFRARLLLAAPTPTKANIGRGSQNA